MKIEGQSSKKKLGQQKKQSQNQALIQAIEDEIHHGVRISEHQEEKMQEKNNSVKDDFKEKEIQIPKRAYRKNAPIKKRVNKKDKKIILFQNRQFQNFVQQRYQQVFGYVFENEDSKFIRTQSIQQMDFVLDKKIEETVNNVFKAIFQNIKEKRLIVIALHVKRSQIDYLKRFINKIYEFKFQTYDKSTMHISCTYQNNVRNIAMQIPMKQNGFQKYANSELARLNINFKNHLQVYISTQITNLSKQNIDIFDQTIIKGNYAVILPTFQDERVLDNQKVLDIQDQRNDQCQKYYFRLYDDKQSFIELFYKSIVSKTMMGYIPCQAQEIIKLYDKYTLSCQEGCKMFIDACQLFHKKCKDLRRPQKKFVQLKQLVRIFNRTWKSLFGFLSYFTEQIIKSNYQQFCHLFLDQKAVYNAQKQLIQNFISIYSQEFEEIKEPKEIDDLTIQKFYQIFQKKFKAKLGKEPLFKPLVEQMELFDLKKANFKDEIQFFSAKITHVFKLASQGVRDQPKFVPWSQIYLLNLVQQTRSGFY